MKNQVGERCYCGSTNFSGRWVMSLHAYWLVFPVCCKGDPKYNFLTSFPSG